MNVAELTKVLNAEREAHAAEVAGYRAALHDARGTVEALHHVGSFGINSDWAFSVTTGTVADINDVLVGCPPTAAVEAVEGMRKALLEIHENRVRDEEKCVGMCEGPCSQCVARAALAAYEEALRGA